MDIIFNIGVRVIAFILLPFLYWRSLKGRKKGFFDWINIKFPKFKSKELIDLIIISFCIIVYIVFLYDFIIYKYADITKFSIIKFSNYEVGTIISIIIYSFFQIALGEEIFFRGFIKKFFSDRLGYFIGNVIQAILYGLFYLLILRTSLSLPFLIGVIACKVVIGYALAMVNEKKAKGSIITSFLISGLANTFSILLFIFLF
ncbi:MAG: type II CAAX prenyl endopeptidase Rce1 family protein [Anaerorhabdus sp.]